MKKKIDTCILGNGPTARICSSLIETSHILISNQNNLGSLSQTTIGNSNINLIPIFPVYNSFLYNELWKNDCKKEDFLSYSEQGNILVEFGSIQMLVNNANTKSYVAQCLNNKQDVGTKKNIILAYKLFGKIIFEMELNRLLAKVKKHYNGTKTSNRIGYINNLSPYYEKVKNIKINNYVFDEIKNIDTGRKIVYTKTFKFEYDRLISTINLRDFLPKVGFSDNLDLISSPAHFCLIKTNIILPINLVIYDVEIQSPIYRLFTISKNFIIIQLAFGCQNIESTILLTALHKLLGHILKIQFEYRYTIKDAYPICTSSDTLLQEHKSELESNNIHLIGRYAEWEYLDLHELDYSKLYENIVDK